MPIAFTIRLIALGAAPMLMASLALAASAPSAPPLPEAPESGKIYLFHSGNRASEFEPCGCAVKDLGGVQYEGALLRPREGWPMAKLDAGGLSVNVANSAVMPMKTRFLLRAMTMLQYDVVNAAQSAMKMPAAYYEDFAKDYPGAPIPFVSCNVYKDVDGEPGATAFPVTRIVEIETPDGVFRLAVTGAASKRHRSNLPAAFAAKEAAKPYYDTGDFLIGDPYEALKKTVPGMREGADAVCVLYDGGYDETQAIAESVPGIDLLIGTLAPPQEKMYAPFATSIKGVWRIGEASVIFTQGNSGKQIGLITLAPDAQKQWRPSAVQAADVSVELTPQPDLAAIVEEYHTLIESLPAKDKEAPQTFAGQTACTSCHRDQQLAWRQTDHFNALKTLVAQSEQFNPECLKCHTLGFQTDNGYDTPVNPRAVFMAGVQCESCHGPAQTHVEMERIVKTRYDKLADPEGYEKMKEKAAGLRPPTQISAETCRQCHDQANDPDFDYERDILLVDHDKTNGGY